MIVRNVETTAHGRYLFEQRRPERLLVGFHGYAEDAEAHRNELDRIAGIGEWSVASVQALHPFYTRTGAVVASWMTSIDRELAIADNTKYVKAVLASLPAPKTLVYSGFSQGATMAIRAAAWAGPCAGLIMLGGDIPSEIKTDPAVKLPPVLIGRGERDEWYSEEKFKDDLRFLESRTTVVALVFDGGHEWTDAFRTAAADFLKGLTG